MPFLLPTQVDSEMTDRGEAYHACPERGDPPAPPQNIIPLFVVFQHLVRHPCWNTGHSSPVLSVSP